MRDVQSKGLTIEEIERDYPDDWAERTRDPFHHRPPGGENVPDLIEPEGGHVIDAQALADWLQPHLPAARGGVTVQQFQGGMSNPTYRLALPDGSRYVLRKKPPGKLLPKAHQIDREYRVMHALRDTDVPVPQMIAMCEDPDVIGAEFFVMEHVEGRIVSHPAMPTIEHEQRRDLWMSLTDTLAALHSVDPAEVVNPAVLHQVAARG